MCGRTRVSDVRCFSHSQNAHAQQRHLPAGGQGGWCVCSEGGMCGARAAPACTLRAQQEERTPLQHHLPLGHAAGQPCSPADGAGQGGSRSGLARAWFTSWCMHASLHKAHLHGLACTQAAARLWGSSCPTWLRPVPLTGPSPCTRSHAGTAAGGGPEAGHRRLLRPIQRAVGGHVGRAHAPRCVSLAPLQRRCGSACLAPGPSTGLIYPAPTWCCLPPPRRLLPARRTSQEQPAGPGGFLLRAPSH